MKKILVICGSLEFGGVQRFAANIIKYAPSNEFKFDYLIFEGLGDAFAPEVAAKGGRVIALPSPSKGHAAYIRTLGRLMRENRYDVVHSHTQFNSGLNLWVARRNHIPIRIAHSHTTAHETKISFFKRTYEQIMRRLIKQSATHRCACGVNAGKWMYGEEDFTVIHNGIDTDSFRFSVSNREMIRALHGVEKEAFLIGHAGTLSKLKNQEFLIRMLPELLKAKPDTVMMFLGRDTDSFKEKLEETAEQCGVRDKVIFTGPVMNVREYLSAFDVYAFPSLREGTPVALIEAQANGLPCVISDRIPQDAIVTELVRVEPLENVQAWIRSILAARRDGAENYADEVDKAGYGVHTALEPLYQMYRGR